MYPPNTTIFIMIIKSEVLLQKYLENVSNSNLCTKCHFICVVVVIVFVVVFCF